MNKRGQVFGNFTDLVKGAVVVGMFLVVGFLIIAQIATQTETTEGLDFSNATQCATSHACNATETVRSAIATIPGWIPLLILVVIAAVILALVNRFGNR